MRLWFLWFFLLASSFVKGVLVPPEQRGLHVIDGGISGWVSLWLMKRPALGDETATDCAESLTVW